MGISLWLVVQDDGAQRAAAQARPRQGGTCGTLHKVPPARVPVSGPRPVRWVPEEYGGSILLYLCHSMQSFHFYIHIPVVPHKAVAEVSKIGNL